MEVRLYYADFRPASTTSALTIAVSRRSTIREITKRHRSLGQRLFDDGSNGVVYRSVRDPGGDCLVCYRPRLVLNVRAAAHYEYRWDTAESRVRL